MQIASWFAALRGRNAEASFEKPESAIGKQGEQRCGNCASEHKPIIDGSNTAKDQLS